MAKSLHARLVAYRPFGARIGVLAEPVSFSASMLHNDDGALSLEYSLLSGDAQAFDRELTDGLEVAVEVSDGSGYREPDNARFVITGRSGKTDDRTKTITYSGQSISWLLSKAENNDSSHLITDGDNKGKRPFYSSNPGTILKTLLDENRARGGVATGLTLGFDTAKDAGGAAWAKKYTLYYSLGTDLQTILSALVNGGGCDWRTSGRTLKLWNADSTALSRDLSKSIVLQLARDISEAPFEESIADLASTILVEGDNNLLFRMDNPAAPTPWGKWESYSSQGGVSDKDTAQAFMQSTLDDAARVRGQYTRDLVTANVDNLPLIDYHAGDWITAPTVAHGEKVRVQEIDLSMRQNEGLSCSIALNDIKYDASVRQAKKIKGITGGAALAGSESGTTVSTDHDHRVPKAPQGLVVQTDAYIGSDGFAHGLATAMWSAVTEATNNTAIEISNYAIEWRKHVDGAPWHSAGTTDKTQLGFGGLDCGTQIEVRVRAVPTYSDKLGEWSSIVVATVESDTTPCSVPSKPTVSSKLGVVTVHWDGKTSTGASMESDFDHIEVCEGVNAAGMQVISANQSGQGAYVVTGLTAGSQRSYALRSVDHAGNKSDWSAIATVTVASAVSPDEVKQIQKDLADNQTALKDNSAKLTQAQKDIAANQQAQAATSKELESAKADIKANQSAIGTANATLRDNTAKLTQAQKDIQANKTGLDSASKSLAQAQSDLSQARKDIAQTKSDLATANGEISKAKESAAQAYAEAHSKNHTFRGPDEPKDNLIVGDLWLKTQKYWTRWQGEKNNSPSMLADFYTYWTGAPNNSPSVLVPLADRVVEVLTWDGTRFEPFDLVANNILAAGTVAAKHLAADSVTAEKVKANAITVDKLAANSVTTEKLVADAVTAAKLAANSVQARNIVALAITADKLAANSVTTSKLKVTEDMTVALLNVHKIQAGDIAANAVTTGKLAAGAVNADKLAANSVTAGKVQAGAIGTDKLAANAVTTAKLKVTEDMTVALLNVHKIQAGDIVSGAVTTDKLAANAVNADKLAANSVNASKIVTGAITADKLAANSVTAVKIAAGTITSDKVAAGQFKGYVFTGAIFQSSEAENTGMKLNGTALQMWDSNHNRTVYLDGEGKSNLLTGTFQTRTSGHRVRISPDYQTYIIGGSETFTGDGIEFPAYNGSTAYFSHPAIASVIQSNQVGAMGELDLWSGHVSKNDPAAFMSLRSKPRKKGGTGSGGVTSRVHAVANTDYDEADESKKSSAFLTLSGDSANGSECWLEAQDANGEVGVGANIGTGYVYLGGYLGGITNRFTFHAQAAWKAWYPNPGSKIATGASMQVDCTFSPTKYGHYYVVANADSQWAGIIAHPMNTGGQSGFTLKLYNADQPCPVDVYAEFLAYLVK